MKTIIYDRSLLFNFDYCWLLARFAFALAVPLLKFWIFEHFCYIDLISSPLAVSASEEDWRWGWKGTFLPSLVTTNHINGFLIQNNSFSSVALACFLGSNASLCIRLEPFPSLQALLHVKTVHYKGKYLNLEQQVPELLYFCSKNWKKIIYL